MSGVVPAGLLLTAVVTGLLVLGFGVGDLFSISFVEVLRRVVFNQFDGRLV